MYYYYLLKASSVSPGAGFISMFLCYLCNIGGNEGFSFVKWEGRYDQKEYR